MVEALKTNMGNTENIENTGNSGLVLALSNQMADAVEKISQSLVRVNGRQRQSATGIVLAPDLILTADHVLEREEDLSVETPDKCTLSAQFVGRDISTDVAVLRVANLNLPPATTARDTARVGQFVLAVGRPTSDGPMASLGIVSAVGGPLNLGRGLTLEQYIRTDAIPYPGFSGGPLVNTEGAVLGLMTTGLVGGLALIVPTNLAWRVGETLAQHGYIKRGYLGISSQPVEIPTAQKAGRAQEVGLLIVKVEENSPAQNSGLLIGDILLTIDGKAVNNAENLRLVLTSNMVGKPVAAEIIRGGNLQTLQVTVGERR